MPAGGRLREFAKTFAAAALAWLAVNLPVMIAAPSGLGQLLRVQPAPGRRLGLDLVLVRVLGVPKLGNYQLSTLNEMSAACFGRRLRRIVLLTLGAPRRPRVAQLFFLLLAAFLISNKVWSPQYVVWLVPLVVLARPRSVAYVLWQARR